MTLSKRAMEAMFNDDQPHPLTTSTIEMRLFENKLGRDKPLKFVLGYKDLKIKFHPNSVPGMYSAADNCITTEFILKLYVYYDFDDPEHKHMNLPTTQLLYDEIPFKVSGNVHTLDKLMYLHLNEWTMNFEHGTKHYPHQNSMNMTPTDYLEFLSQFKNELRKDKEILNNIMRDGIKNPWAIPEFNTVVILNVGSVFLMFT